MTIRRVRSRFQHAFIAAAVLCPAIARAQNAPASSPRTEAAGTDPDRAEIVVTGRADQGYRIEDVPILGPLGERSIQDTPYSVSAISADLAKNIGANSTDAVFRINPFTQQNTPSGRNGQTFLYIRGLSVSNKFVDNLRVSPYELIPIEDKEQIDVILGPTGFLYGRSDPGGAIDYVLKRPTSSRFADLTVGDYYGRASIYGHLDAGGPIDQEGRFGYRVNLLAQTGDTEIDRQKEDRYLASLALDWNLTSRLKLQFDYSYDYDKLHGSPAAWNAFPLPNRAPPPADVLWSQPWVFSKYETNRGALRLVGDLNDVFRIRSSLGYSVSDDTFTTWQAAFTDPASTRFTPFVGVNPPVKLTNLVGYGFLDARFSTGTIRHVVTIGIQANRTRLYEGPNFRQFCLSPFGTIGFQSCTKPATSPFSIAAGPTVLPNPGNAALFANYKAGRYLNNDQRNVTEVIGDDITLTLWAELLVGVSRVDLASHNYNAAGTVTADYDKSAWTPNASVVLKPLPWLSGYFTYSQGLEQGTIVGVGFTNTGQVLPPNRTEQYEVGVKARVAGALLTAALFQLDRPNQFSNLTQPLPTFVSDGLQRDKGLELSATGKILPRLSVVAGATFLDATVRRSNNPAVIGKRPVGVAETLLKGYLDYELPFTHGLFLSGGVNYTGKFAVDAPNTAYLPSVATYDIGARLERVLFAHPTIFRVYASNITNKSYWVSNNYEGDPVRVSFSVTGRF